jgi:hypothetical protein
MKRIDVVKRSGGWIGESGGRTVARAGTKRDAVKETARVARADREPVTVKIHGVDGRMQQERTYPRSADPRRSSG